MNLTSPSQVKDWCIRNGFHPNRVLGQNFLIDRNVLDFIIDTASPQRSTVLEIGPGLGVLTEGLLGRGCSVTAIEKDPVLADRLKESLGSPESLTVLKGDALDYIKRGACDGFPMMVSNLPYQAGTRILIELADRLNPQPASAEASASAEATTDKSAGKPSTLNPPSLKLPPPLKLRRINRQTSPQPSTSPEVIVVLVQTEVADRLAAQEGSKTRGLAGVRMQLDYDVSVVRKVAASCFWPRPEVGSSIVKLVRHHRNDNVGADVRATFRRMTKQAFEHRRKQLGSIFKGIIESSARAEELSNADWLDLCYNLTP